MKEDKDPYEKRWKKVWGEERWDEEVASGAQNAGVNNCQNSKKNPTKTTNPEGGHLSRFAYHILVDTCYLSVIGKIPFHSQKCFSLCDK